MNEKPAGQAHRDGRLLEAASYLLFGLLTTLLNWALYWAFSTLLGLRSLPRGSGTYTLAANASNVAAWVLSVLFAYVTNRRFVFRSGASGRLAWREFALFVSARVLSLLLFDVAGFNAFILFLDDRIAKLIMNALVVLFNYAASRRVIFKKREGAGASVPAAPSPGDEQQAQQLQHGPDGGRDVGHGGG